YLDFSGFDRTKAAFEEECSEKNKPIAQLEAPALGNEKLHLVQSQMLEFYHEGKGDLFFKLWNEYLPPNIKDEDSVSQKLEFYLNIYFAIYPIKYNQPPRSSGADGKNIRQQLVLMGQQVVEAEKKASSYLKRHAKVQNDYHNLIGITADLVDALEATVQGRPITPEYLQQLCTRLFNSHMSAPPSVDLTRPGTAGEALRASVVPPPLPLHEPEETYPPLDFNQVKGQITDALDRKKALILQALRWRLTQTRVPLRDQILSSYIQNDILGCTNSGPYRETIMNLLLNSSDVVKQYLARLYNACASMCAGRGYLSTNPDLLPALMDILKGEEKDHIAQEMVLGALQKLSLRRLLQTAMIERGVIEWLVGVLEDNDSLSDYTLEYSVALLMNLCLRTAGKKRCVGNSQQTLKVLSDLLGHENTEIRPYVNGALYSILAIPSIREDAKAMGMEEILRCFLKDDQPDMNRQIEFIIKQLNSDENGEDYESDEEEDDEDEEEDQEMLEADLDKDEPVRARVEAGELGGERLLGQFSLGTRPVTAAARFKKKHGADEPLQRPATPGNRRGADQNNSSVAQNSRPSSRPGVGSVHNTPAASRPATGSRGAAGDVVRPPTRSGSRPVSQQGSSVPKASMRPPSQSSDRAYRPSTRAMDRLGDNVDMNEYRNAFGTKARIPRTPDPSQGNSRSNGNSRPTSRGLGSMDPPPQPQFSESGPRPSSAGKSSASGSPRKGSSASIGKPKTPNHR
ncbi:lish domain-containing protein armc9, partial [Plakobranchus ocellatus]